MSSPVSGVSSAGAAESTSASSGIADKEAFLKLLVAQIKNQDPLNPTDGVQFLTQLAQFSQLEQLMAVGKDVSQIREALVPEAETKEV
ncbi:MAG TPA: flagellar hook capping FlgD N-terminal domain-containing protein [Bryobacteraceae bacterium]|nr:flagellar hook capping FlgD N-terminal domain-containing protein [Bryobacteraceae bacterium]